FHWRIECSGLFELGASRFGSSAALGSMVNTRQQHTSESAPRQPLDGDGTAAAEDRLTRAAGTRQSLWSRIIAQHQHSTFRPTAIAACLRRVFWPLLIRLNTVRPCPL